MSTSNYIENKIEGLYECFYENGNISIRCNYVNNELEGLYEKFDINGNIILIVIYNNERK